MKPKVKRSDLSFLRQQAEQLLRGENVDMDNFSAEDALHLIHRLQVYQIKLKTQNEELRRVQQSLEAARDKYANLYDFAPVGYLSIDEMGVIQEANLTVTAMLGVERDTLIGQPLSYFIASEDQDTYYLHHRELFFARKPQTCELRLMRADRSHFHAQLKGVGVEDSQGQVRQCRIAVSDITQSKQTEKTLKMQSRVLENMVEGVNVTDEEGIIYFTNPAFETIFGYEPDELLGQHVSVLEINPPGQRAQFVDEIREQLEANGVWFGEFRNRKKDGTPLITSARISLLKLVDKTYRVCVQEDITQRKQAEQEKDRLLEKVRRQRGELRALTIQLAEAEEAERKQLARELHDQVGPNLTALGLNLNIIQGQIPDSMLAGGAIQTRLSDSQLLLEQITERIRDVMADLRPPVLDDYGLVAALRWCSTRFAARMNLSVTVQGKEPLPRLATSVETALFRIAQEALTNTAKHAQASQVILKVETMNDLVCLTITDDGRGFESSYPLEPTNQQGWGLLTMTERAEVLNGHCSIVSYPGQGTQVIVEIPR